MKKYTISTDYLQISIANLLAVKLEDGMNVAISES